MKVIPSDSRKLTDFKVLAFDCFGTLVDWESGIYTELQPLRERLPSDHPLKNDRNGLIAAFNKEETLLCSAPTPLKYSTLLAQSHLNLHRTLHLPTLPPQSELDSLSSSIGRWPAFPDTVAALHRLQKNNYKLAILTNCDNASFAATLAGPLADVEFDAVYIAEEIGTYKPHLNNFRYLLRNVERDLGGIGKERVLMTAHGLRSDHVPAREIGLASVWIARGEGKEEGGVGSATDGDLEEVKAQVGFTWRFDTLGEMADEVEREVEGAAGAGAAGGNK